MKLKFTIVADVPDSKVKALKQLFDSFAKVTGVSEQRRAISTAVLAQLGMALAEKGNTEAMGTQLLNLFLIMHVEGLANQTLDLDFTNIIGPEDAPDSNYSNN